MDVNQNELRVLWSKLSPSLNRVSSVIWAGRLSLSLAAAASSQHHRRVLHVDECVLLITYTAVKLIKIDYIFYFFFISSEGNKLENCKSNTAVRLERIVKFN